MVNKKGQGLVEYGLLLAGVAIVAVAVFGAISTSNFSDGFTKLFTDVGEKLSGAAIE